jgi:hypothetical protein
VTKRIVCLLIVLAALVFSLGAVDFANGHIRISLNAGTGRFSLYYLTGFSPIKFDSLFSYRDPRTSLLTVYYNEKAYKLGDSNNFKIRLDHQELNPAMIFESSFLRVTERFEFIKTGGASSVNGVKITFLVENTGSRRAHVGLRFLLDTILGEGRTVPLATDLKPLNGETTFDSASPDKWWVSENDQVSLRGSLGPEGGVKPDLVHVANWKRLNDVPWKLRYSQGRNFSNANNTGDSALAYYFDPRPMMMGESFSVSLLLAANDPTGFIVYNVANTAEPAVIDRGSRSAVSPSAGTSAASGSPANSSVSALQTDRDTLRDLLARIDRSINSDFQISDEELLQLEQEIARLRSRYGNPEPR